MPEKSICAIAGRSWTTTTSTSPSRSRLTSRKNPVANSARIACGGLLVGHRVADLDRQVAEDGAGLGALYALDADVLDDERLDRGCGDGVNKQERQQDRAKPAHEVSRRTGG